MKVSYLFINERGKRFGRMGIGSMSERAGEAAGLPFATAFNPIRTGGQGNGHTAAPALLGACLSSPIPCVTPRCRQLRSLIARFPGLFPAQPGNEWMDGCNL